MFSPADSKHFSKRIDPVSGMAYYVLSTHAAPIQQTFYFVNSGFDDSGRYLWFYCAYPPSAGQMAGVVDFLADEVRVFPETRGTGWMVDPLSGELYWGNVFGIYRRGPHPDDKPHMIARMPAEPARYRGASFGGTHLSFSPDRSELAVDVQTSNGSYIGTVNIASGEFKLWYKTEAGIPYNHAQFCPSDPDVIMCAHEVSYSTELGRNVSPALTPEGIYPRIELIRRDGTREMRTPLFNYATHEFWAPDGKSIYYCSCHNIAHDKLGDSKAESICSIPIEDGNGTWHVHCSKDEKYFIADGSHSSMGLSWWRGCVSTVRFYNAETGKLAVLIDRNPIVEGWTPENPCPYHIDPHPRFVLNDEWVTFTATTEGRVDVALAPVEQLIEATK